jgi:hypothetical protein
MVGLLLLNTELGKFRVAAAEVAAHSPQTTDRVLYFFGMPLPMQWAAWRPTKYGLMHPTLAKSH